MRVSFSVFFDIKSLLHLLFAEHIHWLPTCFIISFCRLKMRRKRMKKTMKRMSLSYNCCPMMSFLSCSFCLRSSLMNYRCSCCSLVMSCYEMEPSTVLKVTMTLKGSILMCYGPMRLYSCCIPDLCSAPFRYCGWCCKTALSLPSGCYSSGCMFSQ
jgi:hypothetical protein